MVRCKKDRVARIAYSGRSEEGVYADTLRRTGRLWLKAIDPPPFRHALRVWQQILWVPQGVGMRSYPWGPRPTLASARCLSSVSCDRRERGPPVPLCALARNGGTTPFPSVALQYMGHPRRWLQKPLKRERPDHTIPSCGKRGHRISSLSPSCQTKDFSVGGARTRIALTRILCCDRWRRERERVADCAAGTMRPLVPARYPRAWHNGRKPLNLRGD